MNFLRFGSYFLASRQIALGSFITSSHTICLALIMFIVLESLITLSTVSCADCSVYLCVVHPRRTLAPSCCFCQNLGGTRRYSAMGHGVQGPQWDPLKRDTRETLGHNHPRDTRETPLAWPTGHVPHGTIILWCHLLEDMYIIAPARDLNRGTRQGPQESPWALGRDTLGTPNHPPWDKRDILESRTKPAF